MRMYSDAGVPDRLVTDDVYVLNLFLLALGVVPIPMLLKAVLVLFFAVLNDQSL